MGNTGYITTKKWVKQDKLEKDIKEILKNRFNDKIPFKIEQGFIVGFKYPFQVYFWIANRNRIEFSAPTPRWGWWVRSVIENELSILYNGWISDEGVAPEKWKGAKNKYPTFKDYLKEYSNKKDILEYIFKVEDDFTPPEVKATYNGNR